MRCHYCGEEFTEDESFMGITGEIICPSCGSEYDEYEDEDEDEDESANKSTVS